MKAKKIIPVLLIAMIMVMTPQGAFATEWGGGDTEDERESDVIVDYNGTDHEDPESLNTIRFKKGYYEPYLLTNVNEVIGNTEEMKTIGTPELRKFATREIKKWAPLASKLIKSERLTKSTWMWKGDNPEYDWKNYFENETGNISEINLPDWLASESERKKLDKHERIGSYASGVKIAKNLNEARTSLADDVAKRIDGHSDRVLSQRKDGKDKQGTLSQIKDVSPDDVFYSNVSWAMYGLKMYGDENSRFYCGYGIALYDFKVIPLLANGLYFPNQGEPNYHGTDKEPLAGDKENHTFYDNPNEQGTISYSETSTTGETISETNHKDKSLTVGAEESVTIGGKVKVGGFEPRKKPLQFEVGGAFKFSLDEVFMAAWGTESTKTDDRTYTHNVSGKVNPHTRTYVDQSDAVTLKDVAYEGPMEIRYKVAIYALNGEKPPIGNYENTGDYCAKFGTPSDVGGLGAIENLRNRYEDEVGDVEYKFGNTSGYREDKVVVNSVNWNKDELKKEDFTLNSKTENIRTHMIDSTSALSFATPSFTMNSQKDVDSFSTRDVHLYELKKIRLKDKYSGEYQMMEGQSFSLPSDSVEGFDADLVPYCGFDPRKGQWEVSDKDPDGNPIDEERQNAVSIQEDANNRWVITANPCDKKIEDIWIKWRLDDSVKYTSVDGVTVDRENDSGVEYPWVKLTVHSEVEDLEIEFKKSPEDPRASAATRKYEGINLYDELPVILKKAEDGTIVSDKADVIYEVINGPAPAAIGEDGFFYPETEGTYNVKATYRGLSTGDNDYAEIEVGAARELGVETTDVEIGLGPVTPEARVDLEGYVRAVDEEGNDWTGDEPSLEYAVDGNVDPEVVEIVDGDDGKHTVLRVTEAGTYGVNVNEVTSGGEPKKLGAIKVEVTRDPGVEPPAAETGLVYNGREQIGVKEGEDYTLKNHIQTNAGRYTATATLKEGKRWSDNGSYAPRSVEFEIARKPVAEPKVIGSLVYNGKRQTGVAEGEGYVLRGSTGIDAGSYDAVATLDDNHIWKDGTFREMTLGWSIAAKPIRPAVKLSATSYTYSGTVRTPSVTVKDGSATLKKDRDYSVSYASGRKNAGKYNVTVTCKGNYSGKATASFTIKKASNPMKVKGKTASVKYKKLKKKTQSISRAKAITVTSPQGRLTYQKVSVTYTKAKSVKMSKKALKKYKKKAAKKIRIDANTGNVTVKKGLKKGTYKVKAKVKAAGSANYDPSAWKAVTFRIKVK